MTALEVHRQVTAQTALEVYVRAFVVYVRAFEVYRQVTAQTALEVYVDCVCTSVRTNCVDVCKRVCVCVILCVHHVHMNDVHWNFQSFYFLCNFGSHSALGSTPHMLTFMNRPGFDLRYIC